MLSQDSPDGRDAIIDGQQRIATTAMLLAAIRDHFRAEGEMQAADTAHRNYLGSYDDEADQDVAHLRLNADDNQFYYERVVDEGASPSSSRESHQLIDAACVRLAEFVAGIVKHAGPSNKRKRIVAWREFIEDEVRVIAVTVPTEAEAFMIFETLDDRGINLTPADLLKNYLFGRAGAARLAEVQNSWILLKELLILM